MALSEVVKELKFIIQVLETMKIEDREVKIKFICSKVNDADLFTKNVNGELYNKHSQKLVWNKSAVIYSWFISKGVRESGTVMKQECEKIKI